MMNFILRVILLLLGLVFAASLAVAALLLAAVWGVRYAWGRLTGKPVTPWVMRFNPRSGFDRFRHAAQQPAEPTAADVVSARARGESVRSPVVLGPADDVTDVRARPVRGD
ncbi:hypothetical protein CY658_22235 [Variovorax sp. RO1]|uniref:Uncharacterized protein n=2 Tax=Comamonadaceae TaxID=80864 RepID=A0A1E7U4K4_9BURK|nr:hypothetical protein CKY39_12760 [Variovorax boronicumulans]PIF78010.1 hypothetical protein CLU95_5191 [Variovorax sp. 54]PLC03529.1 hypothetical protein CY658_22235 [Variovorax sp. RO1]QOF80730.1 hypothetical protein IG196_10295 [Variovorax sp. 38R]TSD60885.1 hypothetical protein FFI97_011725 [Variovorax sp. KBS0712]